MPEDMPAKRTAEQFHRQGLNWLQQGDYRQAAVHFTAAIKLDPDNAILYSLRSDAYRLQCQYKRAIADYQVALQLDRRAPAPRPVSSPLTPNTASGKPLRRRNKNDDSSFLLNLKKRVSFLTVNGIAVSLLLYLFFPINLFGTSQRLAVHTAQGMVEFDGKPLGNAPIFLHPVGVKDPDFPSPRATAKDDGTFALGTYGKDDGAPEGDYTVTVQRFKKSPATDRDDSPPPRNELPGHYARPETSGLTLHIDKGENRLRTITLKR